MRIAVLGGGPGGLLAALLALLAERAATVFAVHGYPIGDGVSTVIVETDEASWRAAGLDAFDVRQPPGPSDEVTRAYLEKLFAAQIDGCPLLVNNSRWANFRTWRTRRWRHREGRTAVVLLGDAAHTAHFSVGSGTKMAMEDAIALVTALEKPARTLTPSTRPSPSMRPNGMGPSPASRTPPVLPCRGGSTSAGRMSSCRRGSSPSTSSAARCRSPSCASATPPSPTRSSPPGAPPTAGPKSWTPPSPSPAPPSRAASSPSPVTRLTWPPDPSRSGQAQETGRSG